MSHHDHHDQHHRSGPSAFGMRNFRPENIDDDAPFTRGPGRGRRGGGGDDFAGPGFGGPGFGGPGFGGPRFGGHGHGPGRRGRGSRRGDVRAAILLLLDEQPRHGYELIQEITERTSGAWSPSPGSVYPALSALEDEGLVTLERVAGRRTASLTPEGTAYVAEHREAIGDPWTTGGADEALAFREEFLAVRDAVRQVARVGTPAQQAKAAIALTALRKELYRLLADDAPADE